MLQLYHSSWAINEVQSTGAARGIAMKSTKLSGLERVSEKLLPEAVPVGATEGFHFASSQVDELASARRAGVRDVLRVDLTEQVDLGLSSARSTSTDTGTTSASSGTVLSTYTSGEQLEYNVTINFKGTWTSDLQQAFIAAAERISDIIANDLPNVTVYGLGKPIKVDDIVISAELKYIDGTGNILGQAGPTSLRTGTYLPATATMQFDSFDAPYYAGQYLWDEIVLHEMLHSIGFGSIWDRKALVSDGFYTGSYARAEYNTSGGEGNIPVETGGGSGTAGSHWSETVFENELMTGYLDTYPDGLAPTPSYVADPLSSISVASLWDLGYGLRSPLTGYDQYSLA
jgi:hypothetical protein